MQQAREMVLRVRQTADEIRERVDIERQKTRAAISQMETINTIVEAGYIHGELPIVIKHVEQGPHGGLFYYNHRGTKIYLKDHNGQKQRCQNGRYPGALSGCGN